jgi:hypothetical protein
VTVGVCDGVAEGRIVDMLLCTKVEGTEGGFLHPAITGAMHRTINKDMQKRVFTASMILQAWDDYLKVSFPGWKRSARAMELWQSDGCFLGLDVPTGDIHLTLSIDRR